MYSLGEKNKYANLNSDMIWNLIQISVSTPVPAQWLLLLFVEIKTPHVLLQIPRVPQTCHLASWQSFSDKPIFAIV